MSAPEKRLLFVTSRLPWPANSGRKVSLFHYIRGLSLFCGYEVSLFVFPEWDQERSDRDKPDFVGEVHFAHRIGKATKLKSILAHSLFGRRRLPFQCALYYSKKNLRALAALIDRLSPDAVIFDMIRTAPYARLLEGKPIKCILDLDDLLSLRYQRQLAAKSTVVGIAGHYAGGMSALSRRLFHKGPLAGLILRAEQRRLAIAEQRFAEKADGVILVSSRETAHLNALLGEEKAVCIPTGVDTAHFAPALQAEKRPATFGFVGNLFAEANRASLSFIVKEVLPRLERDFRFEVAGPCPDELKRELADVKGLCLLGEVDSLLPVVGGWQFTLCPIAFGTGIKTKILEAMAMGRAVITNDVGAEGIGAESGKELLLANDAVSLAMLTDRLLKSPEECVTVGEAGRRFVSRHFEWNQIFKEFSRLGL